MSVLLWPHVLRTLLEQLVRHCADSKQSQDLLDSVVLVGVGLPPIRPFGPFRELPFFEEPHHIEDISKVVKENFETVGNFREDVLREPVIEPIVNSSNSGTLGTIHGSAVDLV